jgi:hypothetical protein
MQSPHVGMTVPPIPRYTMCVVENRGETQSMDERASDRPETYEIRVKGKLDVRWSRWLADLTIVPQPGGESLLSGPVADQAALYGLMSRMRDLGLELISVNRIESDQEKPQSESGKGGEGHG